MRHKVNPHGLRVGVVRNWESRWNSRVDLCVESFNKVCVLNRESFDNLQIKNNFGTYIPDSCDAQRFVKTKKKR